MNEQELITEIEILMGSRGIDEDVRQQVRDTLLTMYSRIEFYRNMYQIVARRTQDIARRHESATEDIQGLIETVVGVDHG